MAMESITTKRLITEPRKDEPGSRGRDAAAPGPEPLASANSAPEFEDLQNQELDPNFGKVLRVGIQLKAKEMFEEARKDPKSDAGLMVYIMLVNELATMKGRFSEEKLKDVYNEELRRFNMFKTVEIQRGALELSQLRLRQTIEKLNRGTDRLNDAHALAISTGYRLDEGKEVNMRQVCHQIAEMVGLAPPPQFTEGGQLNWDAAGGTSHGATEESGCANGQDDESDAQ